VCEYNGFLLTLDDPKFRGIMRSACIGKEKEQELSAVKGKDAIVGDVKPAAGLKRKASGDTDGELSQIEKKGKVAKAVQSEAKEIPVMAPVADVPPAEAPELELAVLALAVDPAPVVSEAIPTAKVAQTRTTQKWTKEEKKRFYETLEQHCVLCCCTFWMRTNVLSLASYFVSSLFSFQAKIGTFSKEQLRQNPSNKSKTFTMITKVN
jgi:hypothetical protein